MPNRKLVMGPAEVSQPPMVLSRAYEMKYRPNPIRHRARACEPLMIMMNPMTSAGQVFAARSKVRCKIRTLAARLSSFLTPTGPNAIVAVSE